jgi:hypothetical protein
MRVTTRAMAPVSSIIVTCKIEVATTRAIGSEATTPARLAWSVMSGGVLK